MSPFAVFSVPHSVAGRNRAPEKSKAGRYWMAEKDARRPNESASDEVIGSKQQRPPALTFSAIALGTFPFRPPARRDEFEKTRSWRGRGLQKRAPNQWQRLAPSAAVEKSGLTKGMPSWRPRRINNTAMSQTAARVTLASGNRDGSGSRWPAR